MPEDTKKIPRLKRALKFLLLSFVLFPLQGKLNIPLPFGGSSQTNNQTTKVSQTDDEEDEDSDDRSVLGAETGQYDIATEIKGNYFVNLSEGLVDGGISLQDKKNYYVSPQETNLAIESVFTDESDRSFLAEIVKIFEPDLSQESIDQHLDNYQILVGGDIDYYLENVRKGSWGTTVLSVDERGDLSFNSISLRQFLVAENYQDNDKQSLKRLVREEFFQSHQYNEVVAGLYNDGYLEEVTGLDTPTEVTSAVATTNLRAFLELFPQQKFLHDSRLGANSYNFYVGETLYAGNPTSTDTIDRPYFALVSFIDKELEIDANVEFFLKAENIKEINEKFRDKYQDYYIKSGFKSEDVQIWNLVGMKRQNKTSPENSIDMKAVLPLPK